MRCFPLTVDAVKDEDEAEVIWTGRGGVLEHLGELNDQLGDGFAAGGCGRPL